MSWKPTQELEIVAGTPPGGGLDRSARALARAIEENRLIDVPVKVVNVGGDGGRKAWVHMDGRAGEGHVFGISSPNMAADYLTGVTKSDPDRYPSIAILYSEYIAFVVDTDSTIHDGKDLLGRFARDPAGVTIALSTSLGNSNHVAVAKVIRHSGADTRAPKIRVFDTALDAVADVVARAAQDLLKETAGLARVAGHFGDAFLVGVEFLDHHHGQKDVVLFEAENRRRIVHQHVGVQDEQFGHTAFVGNAADMGFRTGVTT